MSKLDRYYVDDSTDINAARDIVIRDRISPLGKQTYPTDIAVSLTTGMYPDLNVERQLAKKICEILNGAL